MKIKQAWRRGPGRLDAQWLLLDILKQDEVSWLVAHGETELSDIERAEFERLITRRETGEPLAYILGEWEFYGRRFKVTPDVLVPRPATERLVDQALEHIGTMNVADVGTGSGCIAITLALELAKRSSLTWPGSIYATDISRAALNVAQENAKRHGVLDLITFLQGDMLEPLKNKQIDFIVSNPPYIARRNLDEGGFAPEKQGLKFEPRVALDGGDDGQKYIRQLKTAGVPTVVETTGGKIEWLNKNPRRLFEI